MKGSVCTGIYAFSCMRNLVGVVFFHRSIVNWGRGGVCLHWCNGLPEIYGQLEEGVGSVCTAICAFFSM